MNALDVPPSSVPKQSSEDIYGGTPGATPQDPSAPPNDDNNESLPDGWSQAYTDDGRVYYQNDVTKQTQWEPPPKQEEANKMNLNDVALPYGWSKAVNDDGKIYYQNDVTKQTQWEIPTQPTPYGPGTTPDGDGDDDDDDGPLPRGWRKAYNDDGKVYYQNDILQSTQWDKPTENNNENNNNFETDAPAPAFAMGMGIGIGMESEVPGLHKMETQGNEGE
eukprot:63987_1